MIPLVAACVTGHDRGHLRQRITDGLLDDDEAEVGRFEEAFAQRVGCSGAVAVCSGTVALELAVEMLGAGVITIPSYACEALRVATRHRSVVYTDSTYHVDTARLVQADGTLLVHAFGTETRRGDDLDASVLEDWTLSLGAIPRLKGLFGVCSTHWSKMISTGRGGVVFSNDANLLSEVRALAERRSVTMSATAAAHGISQLQQLDEFIKRRRKIARLYSRRFASVGIECPNPDSGSVFFRYLIAVHDPASKVLSLAGYGIEAGRGVYPPLHRLAGLSDDLFPGAVESVNRLLSVPCHPSVTDAEADYIAHRIIGLCAP